MKLIKLAVVVVVLGMVAFLFLNFKQGTNSIVVRPVMYYARCEAIEPISEGDKQLFGGECERGLSPLVEKTATAWALDAPIYPLSKIPKPNQNLNVYSKQFSDWKAFTEYAFADINDYWVNGFNASGRDFSPPGLLVASEEDLRSFENESGWEQAALNNVFYDANSDRVIVPKNWKANWQQLVVDIAWAYGKAIQVKTGLIKSVSFQELRGHADYLAGVYAWSRFNVARVVDMGPVSNSPVFQAGFLSGDPASLNQLDHKFRPE